MLTTPLPKLDASALPSLESMTTAFPVLLMPVRVQTKFMVNSDEDLERYARDYPAVQRYRRELLVRVYPDQLAIDHHEESLTDSEVVAGRQYWRQALTSADRALRTAHSRLAWGVLLGRYSAQRAFWIVQVTAPAPDKLTDLVKYADEILGQLSSDSKTEWPDDFLKTLDEAFPQFEANDSAWRRAARARCLPERFVVALYNKIPDVQDVQDAYMRELVVDNYTVVFNTGDRPETTPAGDVVQPGETGRKTPVLDQGRYGTLTDLTSEFLELVHIQAGMALESRELPVGPSGGGSGEELSEKDGLAGEVQWLSDFNRAVEVGMGLVVEYRDEFVDRGGFDRLVVVGVSAKADPKEEASSLGQLLQAHAHTSGLSLIPQGTPTNNTGSAGAGFSAADQYEVDTTFQTLLQAPLYKVQPDDAPRYEQRDGQRLATALGLAPDFFVHTAHADGADGQEATLLNRLLWPATYGYFTREMLEPAALSPDVTRELRRFFELYVTGRGPVPSFRIGSVPYGVLPTSWYSQWAPQEQLKEFGQLSWDVLRRLDVTWTERLNAFVDYPPEFSKEVPFFSAPPSQQDILTVLGQEAASVEFYQRYFVGPSVMDTLAHRAEQLNQQNGSNYKVWAPQFDLGGIRGRSSPRRNLPGRYHDEPENPLFSNFLAYFKPRAKGQPLPRPWPYAFDVNYQSGYRKVVHTYADEPKPNPEAVGPIVDDAVLSEVNRIKPLRPGVRVGPDSDPDKREARNYVHWLAESTFDEIYRQDFDREFRDDGGVPDDFVLPNSLLYLFLRQAVLWRYWEAAEEAYRFQYGRELPRQETELFNILQRDTARWQWLYNQDDWDGLPLYEWLLRSDQKVAVELRQYLKDLHGLAGLPTARLERLLAEHLDLGNHRIDAWKTGQVLVRLLAQRQKRPEGVYLGAFGWLEQVRPQDQSKPDKEGVRVDPDNLGYIHAPTINHGVAAAVLRQGYKSRQFETDPENPAANRMAVNLSSERVRRALNLLEGVRTGNSLAALLGRDFEEGLFNRQPPRTPSYAPHLEILRRHFPYADEKAVPGQDTSRTPAPEQDERQLVNGLALLNARLPVDFNDYPKKQDFGSLPDQQGFWTAVLREVDQLRNTLDALGDLTTGESIYQAVVGNVEQAAAMLENVAKGKFPAAPDVVHPPRAGVTLTHRLLLHLPAEAPASLANWGDPQTSALARVEPALNWWLATVFPGLSSVQLSYSYEAAPGTTYTASGTLRQLNWQPIDLFYRLDAAALQSGSAFDEYAGQVVRRAHASAADPARTGRVLITYDKYGPLARLLPLFSRLRQLLAASRPATAADLSGPGSLAPGQAYADAAGIVESVVAPRLADAESGLTTALGRVSTALATAQTLAATPAGLTPTDLLPLRERLYELGAYNVPEAYLAAAPEQPDTLAAAAGVVALVQRRLTAAAQGNSEPNQALRYAEQAQRVLGNDFRISLPFMLSQTTAPGTPASPAQAYRTAFDANDTLLRHHADNPFVVEEWLQGLAPVRDAVHHLEKAMVFAELSAESEGAGAVLALPVPTQLSARPVPGGGEYWLGAEYPGVDKGYVPPTDAVSLVQLLPNEYDPAGQQQGLWLDEWTEYIPQAAEDTSLAFHYDQPNTEAPQTLLLALAPTEEEKAWDWNTLLGTVGETFDLAKKRAVEPANLAFTHLGILLPAVVAPVAQEEVTMTVDLRKLIGLPQFKGQPYLPTPNL